MTVKRTVSIGERLITRDPITFGIFNLGSCLALCAIDQVADLAGIIHCLVPQASANRAESSPYLSVEVGVPKFLEEMIQMGADKKNLKIYVVGCGDFGSERDPLKVGSRNYTMLRKIAWKHNMLIEKECVGGSEAKTVIVDWGKKEVTVKVGEKLIYLT